MSRIARYIISIAFVFTFIPMSHAAVDDSIVKKWIAAGSLASGCEPHPDAEADLSKNIATEKVFASWSYLKKCRDDGNSQDLNLAAAEWYLFIRGSASASGDTFYRQLPGWYTTLKKFASALKLSEYLQTSSQPVSPTDAGVTQWGSTGVEHGLRDYKTRTGEEPSLKSDAFNVGFGFIKSKWYQKKA